MNDTLNGFTFLWVNEFLKRLKIKQEMMKTYGDYN